MSNSSQPGGCGKLLRRTFLFLLLGAIAREIAIFLSVATNRAKTLDFLITSAQNLNQGLNNTKGNSHSNIDRSLPSAPIPRNNQPLPNAPIPKNTVTPKPIPKKVNPEPEQMRSGSPVKVIQNQVKGVNFYQTIIDLKDPQTILIIGLANNAKMANTQQISNGDEKFETMVQRHGAALVANGTFFAKDGKKAVMGNMVSAGKFVKYSQWENFGTTLGLKKGNEPEMITARSEGKPNWHEHWFSLTCGPRLMKNGKIWLAPKAEGFKDPHVLDRGYRTAIGFPATKDKLYLVSFLASLSLQEEAEIMQAIGCVEAMNLDGGASEGLAYQGNILISPQRNLTNVIVVYDKLYPAPPEIQAAWQKMGR